ncbi:arginyltransferase [Candidatus Scalindua japonica]|uniref:Arginyltransferase n=1 Tax=Candidatus Scalindua japonica TaxID=1284222 RepID=A0A286TZN1_9BACT|nr:hypothetical protein [Candidatus Scalindua japonica]GAX61337.1 arginyltransferase [Candidatus Scalindua japonica]
MILHRELDIGELSLCPYMPDRKKQIKYFLASELDESEISFLLEKGWRKFGVYSFQPSCPDCQECIPIRVISDEFKPSKSQRRNLKKNSNIDVTFGPLKFSERAFGIYQDHSNQRFSQECTIEEFIEGFFSPSTPSLQSEYYLNDELIAVGFLDKGDDCLSSVYLIYDTKFSHLGLGTFSISHMQYSQYFNKKKNTSGHLWQGRFYSCVMDEDYLVAALRYVERNPVRAGIVRKPWRWKWSSAGVHVGQEDGVINLENITSLIDTTAEEWKEYINSDENDEKVEKIRKHTLLGRPLGTKDFVAKLGRRIGRVLNVLPRGRPKKQRGNK